MARQFQWLSADGQQLITLNNPGAGYRVLADATTGLNAPPYRFATDTYAGIDGVTVQGVAADANEVVLGMHIQAASEADLRARTRDLTRAMRPKAGPGTLIVTNEDGERRSLTCYYSDGLQGAEARGTKLAGRWWRFALHLMAADPWWYGDPDNISIGLGAPTVFFPILPMVLSPSAVQGQFTVDLSASDDGAYPVWTIIGPGSGLILSNQTTGQTIQVNASLAAGELMTIDTRPGNQSIRRGDGTNLMGALSTDPALWKLIEDVNVISAVLTGATSASRIAGNFQARYAGA